MLTTLKPTIKIFADLTQLSEAVAEDFFQHMSSRGSFTVAFSGGRTPITFFQCLAHNYAKRVNWQKVHIFWVDERCVPPDHPDSNYGMARSSLLDLITISANHIHRIRGEAEPNAEAKRYHHEIDRTVSKAKNNRPVFDWMLLGMGADGHIASLFPNSVTLRHSGSFCIATTHPQTGQTRISLTLPVINHSKRICFMVTGVEKAEMVSKVLQKDDASELPAVLVQPVSGEVVWYLDDAAAGLVRV